jgi:DNA-binding NarL/FixJ family response regulator
VKLIRVLLADDHALVRAGIRALLSSISGVEVVAEAADGREVLNKIEEVQPDLVLLDMRMPGLNAFEVLKQTTQNLPNVRIIVFSVRDDGGYAAQALRAGAAGYLPKSASDADLKDAIETVARGEKYTLEQSAASLAAQSDEPRRLTPRQLEILTLIAEGYSTKDIARDLNISVKTVESHRAMLAERLNIYDVAGLVRYAIRTGLIKVE